MMAIFRYVCMESCNSEIRKGPFQIEQKKLDITAPSKLTLTIERSRVTEDVEIALMYRSYWKSYCYNGGSLDWNTGCFNDMNQLLPSYEEATEWIRREQCSVGAECTDCWGSAAQQCIAPETHENVWVKSKELEKITSNNHFAFHTCNLSWRCGIKKSKFPTFLTRKNNQWEFYTEMENGTALEINNKDFWKFDDLIMKKTKEPSSSIESIETPCFKMESKYYACYDEKYGSFIEFKEEIVCTGKTCYRILLNDLPIRTQNTARVNLHAASIEDLRSVIAVEHMLNEELRYNFGLVLEELTKQRNILVKMIISASKIDDRLLGAVLGKEARSKFITDEKFYLLPCKELVETNSNCRGETTYKNGRWQKRHNDSSCITINDTTTLDLLEPKELWLPNTLDQEIIGTTENMEGWTYYAKEQENIHRSTEWTQNVQSTTSIGDIMNYPKGFIDNAILGFASLHILLYSAAIVIGIYTCWKNLKPNGFAENNEDRRANNVQTIINIAETPQRKEKMEEETTQNRNKRLNWVRR